MFVTLIFFFFSFSAIFLRMHSWVYLATCIIAGCICLCSSKQCVLTFEKIDSRCKPGEFMTLNQTCQPCPANSFMDNDNHTCTVCFPCTNYSLDLNVVAWEKCTPVKDRIITKCESSFYPRGERCNICPLNECHSIPACCDSSDSTTEATLSSLLASDSSTSTMSISSLFASDSSTSILSNNLTTCPGVCEREESRNMTCHSSGEIMSCQDFIKNRTKGYDDKDGHILPVAIVLGIIGLIIAAAIIVIVRRIRGGNSRRYHPANTNSDQSVNI